MVEDKEKNPSYVWNDKDNSDPEACTIQNGDAFGYIPLNNVEIYDGPE